MSGVPVLRTGANSDSTDRSNTLSELLRCGLKLRGPPFGNYDARAKIYHLKIIGIRRVRSRKQALPPLSGNSMAVPTVDLRIAEVAITPRAEVVNGP